MTASIAARPEPNARPYLPFSIEAKACSKALRVGL